MLDRSSNRFVLLLTLVLILALLATMVYCVLLGAVNLSPDTIIKIIVNNVAKRDIFPVTWTKASQAIVWELRFPKVIAAACVGAGLSLAGLLMQALTRNPLADPYVLGISSGASTGAVLSLLVGTLPLVGRLPLPLGAFLGAILACLIVFIFAGVRTRLSSTTLVLTGMALSALFSSLTNLIIFLTPDTRSIASAMFWMTGSFSGILWEDIPVLILALIISILAILPLCRPMDLLLLGEDIARTNGVDIFKIKTAIIFIASLLTAVMVSRSGIIGFVGLVIPHISRSIVGSLHKRLLPISMLLGAILLLWADVFSRVFFSPQELPVGIVTALIGAPFFLYKIRKSRNKEGF